MPASTKLTPKRHAEIVRLLSVGCTRETAANAAGITDRTLRNWLAWGEQGKKAYRQFYEDVVASEGKAEAAMVAVIARAGQQDWKAMAWLLERRAGNRYRFTQAHELTGKDGGPIETKHHGIVILPPEDVEEEDTGSGDPVEAE